MGATQEVVTPVNTKELRLG